VFRVLFAAVILVIAAADASAQKTDVVTLRNGDRMTCEIKELSRGQLKLSTDDMGTIYVEWDKVASVRTTSVFEIVTISGAIHFGMLGADSGNLLVVAADGASVPLYFLEVVSFVPIRSGFWGRIDGSFDLGGSYTQSSGVGQLSVGFNMTFRRPNYEVFTNFDANVTTQQEVDATARMNLSTGYTRLRPNRWTVTPFAYVERNQDLGLEVRGAGAFTIGRYLVQSPRGSLLLSGGLSAGVEQPIEGAAVSNLDALVAMTSSYYRYDFPKRNIDVSFLVFPSLNDWGRVRANAQVKLKQEIVRDFFASISAYNIYDSRPVVEDANLNDFGVTFSIGWTF
jgi:hypothetical protein